MSVIPKWPSSPVSSNTSICSMYVKKTGHLTEVTFFLSPRNQKKKRDYYQTGNHQDNLFWPLCYYILEVVLQQVTSVCSSAKVQYLVQSNRPSFPFPYLLPTSIPSVQSFLGLILTSPICCAVRGYKGIKWGVDTSLAQRRPNRSKTRSTWLLDNPCAENSFLMVCLSLPHCHWPILREF